MIRIIQSSNCVSHCLLFVKPTSLCMQMDFFMGVYCFGFAYEMNVVKNSLKKSLQIVMSCLIIIHCSVSGSIPTAENHVA